MGRRRQADKTKEKAEPQDTFICELDDCGKAEEGKDRGTVCEGLGCFIDHLQANHPGMVEGDPPSRKMPGLMTRMTSHLDGAKWYSTTYELTKDKTLVGTRVVTQPRRRSDPMYHDDADD